MLITRTGKVIMMNSGLCIMRRAVPRHTALAAEAQNLLAFLRCHLAPFIHFIALKDRLKPELLA
jgi:hypothetical protein